MRYLKLFVQDVEGLLQFLGFMVAMIATVLILGGIALGVITLVVCGLIYQLPLVLGSMATAAVVYGGAKLYLVQPRA